MKFRVLWMPSAENELATTWLGSDTDQRASVTRAAHLLEKTLSVDAHEKGESCEGDDRILFEAPLAISFDVDTEQQIVRVWHVWSYRKRHP